jgi:2-amino-4-hydroxy-6-hydroxymethyldihydropteridine diphosphokinase
VSDLPVIYLALGANIGDRERNLAVALRRLEPLVRIDAVSSLYETDPVPPGQPPYLNAAVRAVTGLRPRALMRHIKEVEREIGRRGGERWGPRPIDIDLLLYGDVVGDDDGVSLPHPELANRPFVLIPLAEIAADIRHPVLDKTIESVAKDAEGSGVRRVAEAGWQRRWPLPPA